MTYSELVNIILLLITMFLWGTTPLLEKVALKETEPLAGVLIRSLAITVILFIVYIFNGRIGELTKMSFKNIALYSASGFMAGLLGMWTYFYVLKAGLLSKIVPIAAAYPLITAVLSILIMKEEVTLQRMAGILLTIIGIILIQQS